MFLNAPAKLTGSPDRIHHMSCDSVSDEDVNKELFPLHCFSSYSEFRVCRGGQMGLLIYLSLMWMFLLASTLPSKVRKTENQVNSVFYFETFLKYPDV